MNKQETGVLPLSVVLISLNEQSNIERVLHSVQGWAQEVLVYDTGSTDLTVEIATKMGAKVIVGEWQGFGKTKKKATELATYDWVLSLDCDEEVTPALKTEIQQKWSNLNPEFAYRLPRRSRYLGRWIRRGGWYPDYQTRLFNKKNSNWNEAEIHEKVQAKNHEVLLSPLNHYVFKNIEHQVSTNNRYSSLQAAEMHRNGRKFSWLHLLTKPAVKFIECYFLKLGFLDAWPGYVIARNASVSVFLKWAKLKELERQAACSDS